jgi:hypothetical protein
MAEQEKDFQHEADFLAAVLEHKDMPIDLTDYISDSVLEIAGGVALYTPDVLRVAWPLIRQQEGMGSPELFALMVMAIRAMADEETDQILDEIAKANREERAAAAEDDEPGDDEPELSGRIVDTAELAVYISRVLRHPDTPRSLYEVMVDELATMECHDNCRTPSMIKLTLDAFKQRDADEKAEQAGG